MARTVLVAVVLLIAIATPAGTGTALRVLFIGNSYTFCNNLPGLVEGLGEAAGARIHTRMVTVAGSTLREHWERGEAVAAIREGTWDWVVLQEQSSLGAPLMVDGVPRIAEERRFRRAARKFAAEVLKTGARLMFFLTWSARDAPEEQQHLGHAYMTAARELGGAVAPAGLAWEAVRTEHPELDLYTADGAHPARAGSYLAACTVFAALTGRSPQGLPGTIAGAPVVRGRAGDGRVTLVSLPETDAAVLQAAAWRVHRRLAAAGGYLEFPAPAPLRLPELPAASRRPGPAELAGAWEGDLRLFRAPARMELHLIPRGGAWAARMNLFFDGARPDLETGVTGFSVTGEGVRFTDGSHPASRARFRGVFTGEALEGIAELIAPGGRRTAVGSWKLRRKS